MEFEEWFQKKYSYPQLVARFQRHDAGFGLLDFSLTEDDIYEIMQEAWEGRYNTLTYHDL